MKTPFAGTTAIITGAASGIGKALSTELAKRGTTVVLADLQVELAESIADALRTAGGKAWARQLDVTDFSAVKRLVDEVFDECGRLDYIFNNAGIGIGGRAEDFAIEDWRKIIEVNLHGVVNGIQAAYGPMINQGFGHIVNTSSLAGVVPAPGNVAYSGTKFAVAGISQSLRIEAECHGVKVSVICPGPVDTPILGGGKYGKLAKGVTPQQAVAYWKRFNPADPEIFARKVINKVARNKAVIIEPPFGKWAFSYWIYRFSWHLWYWLARKMYTKMN